MGFGNTHNPATQKMEVKVSFWPFVVRRRHRRGMGYLRLASSVHIESNKSYHENNYGIQSAVDSSKDQDNQISIQAGCRELVL